jgi:hypothetical protein
MSEIICARSPTDNLISMTLGRHPDARSQGIPFLASDAATSRISSSSRPRAAPRRGRRHYQRTRCQSSSKYRSEQRYRSAPFRLLTQPRRLMDLPRRHLRLRQSGLAPCDLPWASSPPRRRLLPQWPFQFRSEARANRLAIRIISSPANSRFHASSSTKSRFAC